MTAETDLLPLPEPDTHDAAGYRRAYSPEAVRACVAHASAAKDAEIEALRAEVAEARGGWHMANGTAELAMKHRDAAEARAERLAEALRDARHAGSLLANIAYNLAQDESLSEPVRWSLDDARKRWDQAATTANAALEQETTNGQ